ncbi:hypothetical protein C1H46_007784 [Malus baccata]|uniref:Uncharacterized protein n=1 Tax=Malus baccata TaxID=106549 RepID=A0A540N666_MALBA|nr:hypothetical protein C1H46_007784 [Malus baccata]
MLPPSAKTALEAETKYSLLVNLINPPRLEIVESVVEHRLELVGLLGRVFDLGLRWCRRTTGSRRCRNRRPATELGRWIGRVRRRGS